MLISRVCISCGIKFMGGPRAWRCPDCRIERNKETTVQHKERKKSGKSRLLGSTDLCEICGKPYTVESGLQKYCKDCASEQHRLIDQKQSLEHYYNKKESINPVRNAKRRKPPKKCPVCGQTFETHNASVYCSPECRRKYINQRWNEKYGKQRKEQRSAHRNIDETRSKNENSPQE